MNIDEARAARNATRRAYYRKNRDRIKEQNKEWKDAHLDAVRAASRAYQKLLREQNPEHARELQRRSNAKHRDKRRRETIAWRKKNPGYHARWHAANRLKNPVLYMWRNCRNRAKTLGIEFDLEINDIIVPDICPVLGIKLEWGRGSKTGFNAPNAPSVDRFDPKQGYTKRNILVMSNRANILKRDGTLMEFKAIVRFMEGRACL